MSNQSWAEKNVTILGLSRSGCAVARYVQRRGGRCFLSETAPASPANEKLRAEMEALGVIVEMGGHSRQCFTHSDLVVVSPGIPPSSEIMEQLRLSGKEIISEVEFAFRETRKLEKPLPMVGITGTNGKSTTTTLISYILTRAGYNAPACGNIGIPIAGVIDNDTLPDYLVAELSSFQLEFSPTLKTKVSVFTNFKPDHLDWHGSIEAYQEAKLKLFSGKNSPEWSVALADDPVSQRIAARTEGNILWFSRDAHLVEPYENKAYLDSDHYLVIDKKGDGPRRLFSVDSLYLIGDHNYENVLASASVAYLLGVDTDVIVEACQSFKGLEHRLEKVTEIAGTAFYNDSKATNTDAAISALRAFKTRKVVLIAGGYDKMTPLDDFITAVQAFAESVVLIGAATERFANAFEAAGYHAVEFADSLESAVAKAYHLSRHKGANLPVLFSPACASFDMFKNFEVRGEVFKNIVHALSADEAKSTAR